MRLLRINCLFILVLNLFIFCQTQPFNKEFFAKYVPEFPDGRLMTKEDIPGHQQDFFDEAQGKFELTLDLNGNGIPENIICGVSGEILRRGEKGPYFLTIIEAKGKVVNRLYLQKLLVPPVSLTTSKNPERQGVLVLFAFYSDYAAEIYYEDNEYHLEKLF